MAHHNKPLKEIRRSYDIEGLDEKTVCKDPFEQFQTWFDEILKTDIIEPNAMFLSTAGKDGQVSGRMVLMKSFDHNGFTFFTNMQSRKAVQLAENPHAALSYYWYPLGRQVLIEGIAEKVDPAIAEEYFSERPRENQLAALASDQSREIDNKAALLKRFEALSKKYEGKPVPCPAYWGGYNIRPYHIEFWQGQPSRLHDRVVYTLAHGEWKIKRLMP
jgi:pyridoxamine 5'-phosphate oxidase